MDPLPIRKRPGRPPKVQLTVRENVNATCPSVLDGIIDAESSAISDDLMGETANVSAITAGAAAECRRSSRKKVIKFDVRDLLNKSRKPHKIQIEARIDSNAPPAPFVATMQKIGTAAGTFLDPIATNSNGPTPVAIMDAAAVTMSVTDLTSKQKTFIEKSAIFRRYSISEQQQKLSGPAVLLPPPMPSVSMLVDTSGCGEPEAEDASKIAQARRLSRTQEIFNATMLKSKQNSSLIVAQMYANSFVSPPPRSVALPAAKAKKRGVAQKHITADLPGSGGQMLQRRRGRPRKVRPLEPQVIVVPDSPPAGTRKSVCSQSPLTSPSLSASPSASASQSSQKAQNWREYKASLQDSPVKSEATLPMKSRQQHSQLGKTTPAAEVTVPPAHIEEVILEISSSSSNTDDSTGTTAARMAAIAATETQQRSFAALSFIDGSAAVGTSGDVDEDEPEIIFAGIEEIIISESVSETPLAIVDIEIEESTNTNNDDVGGGGSALLLDDDDDDDIFLVETEQTSSQLAQPCSSKSSSSEDTSTERTSGGSTSSKFYKEGDVLRVKLKRLSIPSATASSEIVTPPSPSSASSSGDLPVDEREKRNYSSKRKQPITSTPDQGEQEQSELFIAQSPKATEGKEPVFDVVVIDDDAEVTAPAIDQHDFTSSPATLAESSLATPSVAAVIQQPEKEDAQQETELGVQHEAAVVDLPVVAVQVVCEPKVEATVTDSSQSHQHPLQQPHQQQAQQQEAKPQPTVRPKERITLPLKKQSSKLKQFEESIAVAPAPVPVPEPTATAAASECLPTEPNSSIIRGVNVETSTLLDILRTVQSNEVINRGGTAATANVKEAATAPQPTGTAIVVEESQRQEQQPATDADEPSEQQPKTVEVTGAVPPTVAPDTTKLAEEETATLAEATVAKDETTTLTEEVTTTTLVEEETTTTTTTTLAEEVTTTTLAEEVTTTTLQPLATTAIGSSTVSSNVNAESAAAEAVIAPTLGSLLPAGEVVPAAATDVPAAGRSSSEEQPVAECRTPPPQPPHKKRVVKIQAELQQQLSRAKEEEMLAGSAGGQASILPHFGNSDRDDDCTSKEVSGKELTTKKCTSGGRTEDDRGSERSESRHRAEETAGTAMSAKRAKQKSKAWATPESLAIAPVSATPSNQKKRTKKTASEDHAAGKGGNNAAAAGAQPSSNAAEIPKDNERASTKRSEKKKKFLEVEDAVAIEQSKKLDEKSARKKRQKKLKADFQAALLGAGGGAEPDVNAAPVPAMERTAADEQSTSATGVCQAIDVAMPGAAEAPTQPAAEEPGQDKPALNYEPPDPLLDIEKFIEAGVNLLKRGYNDERLDDGEKSGAASPSPPQQPALPPTPTPDAELGSGGATSNSVVEPPVERSEAAEGETEMRASANTSPQLLVEFDNMYETPADTPVATPTASPPPPPLADETIVGATDETAALRRSHRIKQITKMPKALVGRGLVRDRERISLKDDVETKSHYSLDDHLLDLAEVEAKNAQFLKDMEERLSNFQVIKENEYKCERVISREARRMICDCFLTADEAERGELGCGDDCLNRLLMIECGPDCNVKERCTNRRFQRFLCAPCRVFRTEKKGFGIMADIEILAGEFILEYAGEVIDDREFERRRTLYSKEKHRHHYFMALRSDAIIDATIKGNISRFINHSCDPNAETQKWTVNGELRIGFFSRKSIRPGEEITFDYQYQRYGREAQRCYCESANCRGWIGQEPNSDEGEQLGDDDDDDDSDVDSDADDDSDDDEDSDDSATDVRKKLEIAAAEARVTPATADEVHKAKARRRNEAGEEAAATGEVEEDSKSKFKRLLSKMAEKMSKKKQLQQQQQLAAGGKARADPTKKRQRRRRAGGKQERGNVSLSKAARHNLEDPDIEDEVNFLSRCGVKNQLDTLRLSRLMVRAKLALTRLNLLHILREGELPCRRLFLDYHGLRLLHGWMSEDGGNRDMRLALLNTLASLPIVNKTVLTETKVYQTVRNWSTAIAAAVVSAPATGTGTGSPSDDSSSKESSSSLGAGSSQSQQQPVAGVPAVTDDCEEQQRLAAAKLLASWDSLPDIFRIPKRERLEQMKEHEREADRQYEAETAAAVSATDANSAGSSSKAPAGGLDRYQRDRFGRVGGSSSGASTANSTSSSRYSKPAARAITTIMTSAQSGDPRRRPCPTDGNNNGGATSSTVAGQQQHLEGGARNHYLLSKEQRRELFAAKVARDEAEKRMAEERRDFETKCRFFGLDPKKTRQHELPFCVVPTTGQWFSVERQPIVTPPSYAHVQVPAKVKSTDPADYRLPGAVAALPTDWRYAITPQGRIYYYHVQTRIPQWEPVAGATTTTTVSVAEPSSDSESDSDRGAGAAVVGDSSEDDDFDEETLLGLDDEAQVKAYVDRQVELRRRKRYNRLVGERCISPRREEDRIYNQMEVRKYKENKEKIRKRKEEIRRRRADAQRATASGSGVAAATATENTANSSNGSTGSSGSTLAPAPAPTDVVNTEQPEASEQSKPAASTKDDDDDDAVDQPADDVLPIQDYLLSSDEDESAIGAAEAAADSDAALKAAACHNSPLLLEKTVDELDAPTTSRALKRSLPEQPSTSTAAAAAAAAAANVTAASTLNNAATALEKYEYNKRRKLEKREKAAKKAKESDVKYRKLKEKFRCDIAGIIMNNLRPYRRDGCQIGRIQSDSDFNHLARKLTHFVMIKELKYCESVGQTLVVTESVKNKSREFIKKYMAKYGSVYEKPINDPEFKEIPFTF